MKATEIKSLLNRMFDEMFSKDSRKDARHLRNYIYNQYEDGSVLMSENDLYKVLESADNY